MYTIYVKFQCYPQKREAFLQKMKDSGILAAIRAEDGCRKYEYYLSDEHPDELLLVEYWESAQHQQVHMTQPHMVQLKAFQGDYIEKAKLGEFTLA